MSEDGNTVDLYGYTTMVVAAVQAQARELEALQREMESLSARRSTRAEVVRQRFPRPDDRSTGRQPRLRAERALTSGG